MDFRLELRTETKPGEPGELPVPKEVLIKIDAVFDEVDSFILPRVEKIAFPEKYTIQYRLTNAAPIPLPSERQLSSFWSFVVKVRDTPPYDQVQVRNTERGVVLDNLDLARHVLNEWRPVIFNRADDVFYERVFGEVSRMLARENPGEGPKITVCAVNKSNLDITKTYLLNLGESGRAIQGILGKLEFDYLYNGILQHSDRRFQRRREDDYDSGELNYVILRHAIAITKMKFFFELAYRLCINLFWFSGGPRQGGLG